MRTGSSLQGWWATLALTCSLAATHAGAEAAKPVVVLSNLQPPFMDLQEDKPVGLAIDITKEMFERAKIPIVFKFMPPKRAYITALEARDHCVLAVERSQEREALFHWVSPILITRHGFYTHPDSTFELRSLEDARPYIIGSYLGSGVGEYLESMGFTVEYAGRNDLNARKLEKKRIDLWASDTVSAGLIVQDYKMSIGKPALVFLTTLQSMACNLQMPREQVKLLQVTLTGMYRDGTIKQKYAAYQEGKGDLLR